MPVHHTIAGLVMSFCLAALPATAQDFPRTGNPLIENGRAAPFVGHWSAGFPDDEQTIVTTVVVTCADPLIIEATDETHIVLTRRNDIEAPVDIELVEFS